MTKAHLLQPAAGIGRDRDEHLRSTVNFAYMPPDERRVGSCYGNCGGGCTGSPDPCGPGGDRWENYVPIGNITADIKAGEPHCNGGVGWIAWWQRYTAPARYIFRGYSSDGCRLHDRSAVLRAAISWCASSQRLFREARMSRRGPVDLVLRLHRHRLEPAAGRSTAWRDASECEFGVDY